MPLQSQPTLANILAAEPIQQYPTKDAMIIFPSDPEIDVFDDLIPAVGSKVGPQNITYAYRMSHNRLCIAFKTAQIADNYMKQYPNTYVKNKLIPAHKIKTIRNGLKR